MPPAGATNPANATLKVDPTTGGFSGTITLPDGSRPAVKYQGLITRDAQPASFTTALAGNNNDLIFTTPEAGPDVNTTTIRYLDPGTSSAAIGVSVSGRAITVSLGTSSGTAQVETATVSGGAAANAQLTVTVTAASVSGSPLSIPVNLTTTEATSGQVAAAIRSALAADGALTAQYTVAGTDSTIRLTNKTPAANDGTLNIAWGATVSGVSALTNSANTTAGVAPSITSTAAQVKVEIETSAPAAALVSVAHASGNTGAGIVTAMTETFLTGGQDGKLRGYGSFLMPQLPGPGPGQTILTSPILSGSVILDEKP